MILSIAARDLSKEMSREATEPPLSMLERTLSVQLLGRIMVPTPPANLGVLPDAPGGPKAVPTFDNALRLIGLQRISRRLRDLVRGLLVSKAGAVLLADAVRHRICISVRGRHSRCRVGYTEDLRDRLLGLAERCTDVAGSSAVCAEIHETATTIVGAPKLRNRITAITADKRDNSRVREQLRICANRIDEVSSLHYSDCLNRLSEFCAQDTVRTIISNLAPPAGAAPGGASWAGAAPGDGASRAGAQRVVLWADVSAGADIPLPLRRLCSGWMRMARADEFALHVVGSPFMREEIRQLASSACASPDCIHS